MATGFLLAFSSVLEKNEKSGEKLQYYELTCTSQSAYKD